MNSKTSIGKIVLVKNKTRLERLTEQFNTVSQASFFIERQIENVSAKAGFLTEKAQQSFSKKRASRKNQVGSGEFNDFQREHDTFYRVFEHVLHVAQRYAKTKILESDFLPSYLFDDEDIVVVVGQDGLVANTAKYTNRLPILGVNPDPVRFDGILLPFQSQTIEVALQRVMGRHFASKLVTMGEVKLNDGQRLLAFNDFFIGPATHTSARYEITYRDTTESQSSSGIIVATGAGSTGWMSSIFNMANGLLRSFGLAEQQASMVIPWDRPQMVFAVREPFLSKTSQINLVAGLIDESESLVLESLMPKNGTIFSDGVLHDSLKFNSGTVASIGVAPEKAMLVVQA